MSQAFEVAEPDGEEVKGRVIQLTLMLQKALGQNRSAPSISGHQGNFWSFSRLHRLFNTLSPLKMAESPLLT